MNSVIYHRTDGPDVSEEEVSAMRRHFRCVQNRTKVLPGELCIARYSALPWYRDLEEDLVNLGSKLINTYKQHRWIADIGNWVEDLKHLTPDTWRNLDDVPDSAFPVVVKGETNSKKFLWNTHMFAKDRMAASSVVCRLQEDGFIGEQWCYFRKYVPLKKLMDGFRGLPVTNEFRVFVCNGKVISKGYYWANWYEDLPYKPNVDEIPNEFLNDIVDCVGDKAVFYVVDVAQTENGDWIEIELNDGQMSVLSMNDPEVLYINLRKETDLIV
jgi:hypothetical protein